VNYIHVGSLG